MKKKYKRTVPFWSLFSIEEIFERRGRRLELLVMVHRNKIVLHGKCVTKEGDMTKGKIWWYIVYYGDPM